MSNTMSPSHNPDAARIIDFWFDNRYSYMRWFQSDPAFDKEISTNFGHLITQARSPTGNLDDWSSTPSGSLALIILLDQFPRNVFRGTADSFSSDPKALSLATDSIAKGFDAQVPLIQQIFFYLPLVHSESLLGQIAARAHYRLHLGRCEADDQVREFSARGVEMAQKHMDVIFKFGRFPSRNKALGREDTAEEAAWMKENPKGFAA